MSTPFARVHLSTGTEMMHIAFMEPTLSEHGSSQTGLAAIARQRIEQHPCFRGRGETFEIEEHGGTITLWGRVPSFYLKQLAQEVLMGLDGIETVDNRVDVSSSSGLSSTAHYAH